MARLMKFLVRQKYRFDLGQGFLAIINFAFVVIAASDKIGTLLHIEARTMVAMAVPLAVGGVWLFGYFLDRAKFAQAYNAEANERNEMLKEATKR